MCVCKFPTIYFVLFLLIMDNILLFWIQISHTHTQIEYMIYSLKKNRIAANLIGESQFYFLNYKKKLKFSFCFLHPLNKERKKHLKLIRNQFFTRKKTQHKFSFFSPLHRTPLRPAVPLVKLYILLLLFSCLIKQPKL